jgi:hypothetical protein
LPLLVRFNTKTLKDNKPGSYIQTLFKQRRSANENPNMNRIPTAFRPSSHPPEGLCNSSRSTCSRYLHFPEPGMVSFNSFKRCHACAWSQKGMCLHAEQLTKFIYVRVKMTQPLSYDFQPLDVAFFAMCMTLLFH